MGSSFGKIFRLTTWGESHGPALGVVIEGVPAGMALTVDEIQHELDRRRVGQSKVTTPRGERDRAEILSGVYEDVTTGAPISLITYNADADSSKYDNLRDVFRPGHADYTYWRKYGHRDHRGGGRSSARETWGRVAAGAIAKKILAHAGAEVFGFAREIGGIAMETLDRDQI
jgi:chorismate synthase